LNRPLWRMLPGQFWVAIVLFFLLFAMTDVLRLLTPLSLRQIAGPEHAAGLAGTAFSLSGVAAVVGVLVLGQRWVRPGRLRVTLVLGALVAAVASALMASVHLAWPFIALFALVSLIHATLIPATNTLIATYVPRQNRGTGFGIASSAQALAMMAGPTVAAVVGGISLALGFALTGVVFAVAALLVFVAVREPTPAASRD
jgi:DHA1 family multidrug resistance protein-like MFS transporter